MEHQLSIKVDRLNFCGRWHLSTLFFLAALTIGIGCVTIPIPAPKETTGEKVILPAAQNGSAIAQLQTALAYRYGTAGMAQNNEQALHWFEQAANSGNIEAQLTLSQIYLNGELNQDKRIDIALAWLHKAADNGSSTAQFELAETLRSNHALASNPKEMELYYEKAARQKHKFAALRLAQQYENAEGGSKDIVNAYAWYKVADADRDATRLMDSMSPSEKKQAELVSNALLREIKQ